MWFPTMNLGNVPMNLGNVYVSDSRWTVTQRI